MTTNEELYKKTEQFMSKLASHATDEELAEEEEEHPEEKGVDEEVDDIGDAGVDGSEHNREDKGKSEAHPSEETRMENTPGDGVGNHETDKELKDEASKTASLISQLAKSGQAINEVLDDMTGEGDSDSEEDKDKKKEKDKEDKEDKETPPESELEETEEEKDDDEEDEEEDDAPEDVENAKEAGRLAAEKVAKGMDVVMEQQKSAAVQQSMSEQFQRGVQDGVKLAQALDAEVQQELASQDLQPPAEEDMQEGGEQVVDDEEVAAIIKLLLDGKTPETDLEKQVAEMIGLPPEGLPGEGGEEKSPEPEGSEKETGSSIKEEMGSSEKVAAMAQNLSKEQVSELFKNASEETQIAILSNALQSGE